MIQYYIYFPIESKVKIYTNSTIEGKGQRTFTGGKRVVALNQKDNKPIRTRAVWSNPEE